MSPESSHPVNVVLCWHMHQPQYQNQLTHEYYLPWTYLHAIKDYTDMAAALEHNPRGRAVVNFTPVLLEQIEDYVQQFNAYFELGHPFNDPLLQALSASTIGATPELRLQVIQQCIKANESRLIQRFPDYENLVSLANVCLDNPRQLGYLDEQFFFDLLVWYHLAWMGEHARINNNAIQRLIQKGNSFRFSDRKELLHQIQQQLSGIIPRYRKLAENNQIELCVSPDNHPILPLLLDFESTLEAMPDAKMPEFSCYPGGKERADQHIKNSLSIFKRHFGLTPAGCWPSEGSISDAALARLQKAGFLWAASGGGVLQNSLKLSQMEDACIHKSFTHSSSSIRCFYRDDNLSDLIGFNYSTWRAEDAVKDLVHHILNIRSCCGYKKDTIVPIILDGENCWEYYPENGRLFLEHLYAELSQHPDIHLTTFKDYLQQPFKPTHLPNLVSGSWVYGNFATWIGDPSKNRAWDLLCQAKVDFDKTTLSGRLSAASLKQAEHQLAICEGSDWFWWFGDYNPSESVQNFDSLFRIHLKNLYCLLGEPPPDALNSVISVGGGEAENAGTMRRAQG